ncbi:MAG: hypothetical protein IKL52_02635 [Candidatus Gastranaerophilales bacterium]|nr:hypothetical protein [Candidatus Gastranaerophilales bacterium]
MQTKKQNIKTNFASSNSILNNSLSEAIGRSQVSFKGVAKNSKNKFDYAQRNLTGSSEEFTYDKTTGVMEYTEKYSNGQIKKVVRVIPKTQEEHSKEIAKDGSYTLQLISPQKTTYQEFDSKNNVLFTSTEFPDGRKITKNYDYENQRIIHRVYSPDESEPVVRVLDIISKQDVSSTDLRLIQKETIKHEDGITEKKEYNLVTGEIYRSELSKGATLIKGFTRSFATGQITWEAVRHDSKLYEEFYSEDGDLRKEMVTDSSQNTQVIQAYTQDGKKLPKIKNFLDRNGNVIKVAQYDLETGKVQYVTSYVKGLKLVDTYNPSTNVRITTEAYKGEELVGLIEYYGDGKTSKTETEYSSEGFEDAPYCHKKVSYCDKRGAKESTNFYSADGVLYETHFYPKNSKKPDVIRKYDVATGKYIDYHYGDDGKLEARIKYNSKDEVLSEIEYRFDTNIKETSKVYNKDRSYVFTRYSETGLPLESITYSKFDEILQSITYYADGKTSKEYVAYEKDGSYRYVQFDRDGNITEDFECNADGSPRPARAKIFKDGPRESVDLDSIEQIVDNIMTIVGSSRFSENDIPMTQWVKFVEYLGLSDVNQLFDMDKKTYLKLSKIYHPDKKPANPNIMHIINHFYKK